MHDGIGVFQFANDSTGSPFIGGLTHDISGKEHSSRNLFFFKRCHNFTTGKGRVWFDCQDEAKPARFRFLERGGEDEKLFVSPEFFVEKFKIFASSTDEVRKLFKLLD